MFHHNRRGKWQGKFENSKNIRGSYLDLFFSSFFVQIFEFYLVTQSL
jgi:hypothetical protein